MRERVHTASVQGNSCAPALLTGLTSDQRGGPTDPAEAWRRLHERCGARATLLDRYALEAAHRGVRPEELSADDRRRLTLEVLTVRTPGREIVPGSQRASSDPIEVVPYDERWPVLFAEWRERLGQALGDTAVRVDHIGSTAVPGLARSC